MIKSKKVLRFAFFYAIAIFAFVLSVFAAVTFFGMRNGEYWDQHLFFLSLLIGFVTAFLCAVIIFIYTVLFLKKNEKEFFELKSLMQKFISLLLKRVKLRSADK